MESFTPVSALLGGLLIGASAATMLLVSGRIAGVSGILGGLVRPARGETRWRIAFLAGLLSGGVLARLVYPQAFADSVHRHAPALIVAGLLVGFGTGLGNGCTSGHGVCGVARLSKRSIVATLAFMATGVLATYVCNHVLGGRL